MNDTVECPYCGTENDVSDWYVYRYEPGEVSERECGHCGKVFEYVAHVEYTFTAQKKEEQPQDSHLPS